MRKDATVYVAAAGPSATGPFGWGGVISIDGTEQAWRGRIEGGTINQAVVRAAIRMVRRVPEGRVVAIVSNLNYLVDTINRLFQRESRDYQNRSKERVEIANGHLWRELGELSRARELWARRPIPGSPTFEWCRDIAFSKSHELSSTHDRDL